MQRVMYKIVYEADSEYSQRRLRVQLPLRRDQDDERRKERERDAGVADDRELVELAIEIWPDERLGSSGDVSSRSAPGSPSNGRTFGRSCVLCAIPCV